MLYSTELARSISLTFSPTKTFKLDEFEVWSAGDVPQNVALATSGAKATGKARVNEDFPGVYGPHLAIDGKTGERFISASNNITIELHQPTAVRRFVFSSARDEANPQQGIFGGFPADYRIEVFFAEIEMFKIKICFEHNPIFDRVCACEQMAAIF